MKRDLLPNAVVRPVHRMLADWLAFPLAALFNTYSMTGLLLVFGLAGKTEAAADIGLVQAATLALFYAFSANARNVVLGDDIGRSAADLLRVRLMLMLPLALGAWTLGAAVGNASGVLAAVLVLRRLAEWMGEIGLAVREREGATSFAQKYLCVEVAALALACIPPLLLGMPLWLCLLPWALAPLVAVRRGLPRGEGLAYRDLLPHFGSTVAIGTSTYVFRVSIALLVGKALAGELFTAFAIGGLLPTLLGNAIGPSLARRYRDQPLPRKLVVLPLAIIVAAGIAALAIKLEPGLFVRLGHSPGFWLATAASVAGGALMSVALLLRSRLIQRSKGGEVYGPDLLANLLIATSVPFVFTMFGVRALGGLYLLSAALNLAFYLGAGRGAAYRRDYLKAAMVLIGGLLVAPVFFQLQGGLFTSPEMVFNAEGNIRLLPLPVSIIGAFLGMAALGNYSAAVRTLTTIFFTAVLFVLTSILLAEGDRTVEMAKLILLAQFLLPLFGMVLGEMYAAASPAPIFEKVATVILLVTLPLQLIATWAGGFTMAHPDAFVFSIYQHLQYFPMIVAAITIMASMALWKAGGRWQKLTAALWPIAMLHLAASLSLAAFAAALGGLLCFVLWHRRERVARKKVYATAAIAVVLAMAYAGLWQTGLVNKLLTPGSDTQWELRWNDKFATASMLGGGLGSEHSRLYYWAEFSRGATESARSFMLGHAVQPDRNKLPSAHNYWLDAIYNFGVLSILPLVFLIACTARLAWMRRRALLTDPVLLGTALACAYLVLGENMLKVGMRQPYPGLITMFVLGLFISRLRAYPPSPKV